MQTRNTAQLQIVYDTLCELANHPTADEVYARVHEVHPTISKATVYRTLNKLADQGRAFKVYTPHGADHFDHTNYPHAHVQCLTCGRIDDVMISLDNDMIAQANDYSDYEVSGMNVQFFGTCPQCSVSEKLA